MIEPFGKALVGVVVLLAGDAARGTDVEAILDRVETRGAEVHDLRCKVVYTVEDRVSDDTVRREGVIRFKKQSPNPIFFITFDKTIQEGTVKRKKIWYLFDGRWFYEASQRSKTIIKRDLAPPGTKVDLFSIEKAPFPIPFGQKKAEILEHFEVTIGPGVKNGPTDTDHLICVPKADSRLAGDYSKMEFFVSRSLGLPVRIVMTANPPDKITTAEFPDLSSESLNTNLPDSTFRLPPETKKYAVVEE